MLIQIGRIEEGEARVRQALTERQTYSTLAAGQREADPVGPSVREAWFTAERELASVETGLGRTHQAISCHRRALVLAQELVREQPSSEPAARRLANVHWDLASLLRDDRPAEAISSYRRASELIEPIARARPSELALQGLLADYFFWLAVIEDRQDRAEDASRDFHRAAAIFERIAIAKPLDPDLRCLLSTCYHVQGRLLVDSGHPSESLDLYRRAIALREGLCRDEPKRLRWREDCAGSWFRLGEALQNLGRITEAADAFQKSRVHARFTAAQL